MLLILQLQQRQQEKKINVLPKWRRAHSYLSGTYYILCCCCYWRKWEISQFEMRPWISVSTVKLVKSKYCSIHTRDRASAVGALSRRTGHKFWAAWMSAEGSARTLVDMQTRKEWIGLMVEKSELALLCLVPSKPSFFRKADTDSVHRSSSGGGVTWEEWVAQGADGCFMSELK